jgi:long-chain acyl-CoA synthetase
MIGAGEATMLDVFRSRAEQDGDRVALVELVAAGAPADRALTWREWHEASRCVAAALVAAGVRRGDAVAILAGNRMLWPVADMGVLLAGAVSVGIYPTSAPAQVLQQLADCGAVAVIVDGAEQLVKVRAARAALPRLRTIVCEDVTAADVDDDVVPWAAWLDAGGEALRAPDVAAEVARRAASTSPDDTALLIYTSGSTGEPKGARIPHRYLRASAESVRDTLALGSADSTLSFLPYCHAGERVFGLYTRVLCGMRTAHVADQSRLWDAARAFEPTLFGGLPRFFEKLHEALVLHERALPANAGAAWAEAIRLGRERSLHRRRGDPVPETLERAWRQAAAPTCGAQLATLLGGGVRIATSGGAALPGEVADYLDAAGLTVLGAYGQTEHLCVAFHRPDRYDTTTAGPPMPGTEVRIADDGELLVRRSALTFAGYHGRPHETREAFTPDGEWLRTGDLAALTADGRLRITGRKKELIALSNGKKIAPLPIEAMLAQDPWIEHAMLYGEGERFVSALLVPSRATVDAWRQAAACELAYEDALRDPHVQAHVADAVARVNAGLSRPEQIRRWVLLEHELTAERGELTPTHKIRRSAVVEHYRDRLDPLYR